MRYANRLLGSLFSFLAIAFLLSSAPVHGQVVLRTDHGVAANRMYGTIVNLLPQQKISYAGYLAVEYLHAGSFYLSTGVGYQAAGGMDTLYAPFGTPDRHVKESFHLLQLNTTMRLKHRYRAFECFVGIGPKVEFPLGKRVFKEQLFSDYKLSVASLGLKSEVGMGFWLFNDLLRLGVDYAFQNDLTPFAKAGSNSLYNRTHTFALSLGFQLKSKSTSDEELTAQSLRF